MSFKGFLKRLTDGMITPFFKRRANFKFLKNYFRGRNYIYDIINFYENNDAQYILDIGANVGQSANNFRKFFSKAKIICFEPVNSTYDILKEKTKNDKLIVCENYALGDKEGTTKINLSTNSGLNSLVEDVNKRFDSNNKQKIKISTVDSYLAKEKIEHINLIKIDTEGFDLNVLKGASETLIEGRVDFIVCEIDFLYESSKGNFEEINRYLQSKGYLLSGIYDNYYWGTKFILHGFANAMFVNKKLALS